MRIYYQISLYCRKQVFFSSQKHGGFQSPKFPSVKPEVSFCRTLSFYLSKCFFLSNPVLMSSPKFSPVNSESCSCQTWIFLLSNPKFPPVKLEVASLRIASFCQIQSFLPSIWKFLPDQPEIFSLLRSFFLSNLLTIRNKFPMNCDICWNQRICTVWDRRRAKYRDNGRK